MSEKTYRSGWSYIGEGLAWLLILTGIGGCTALTNWSPNKGPFIIIKHENQDQQVRH